MQDRFVLNNFKHHSEALLDTLYECALGDSGWEPFLTRLIDSTHSRSARMLLLNEGANRVQRSTKVNIDDSDHQRYVDHFVNTCPWRTELTEKPEGRLYSTYLHFSCRQPEFYETEFYNDWARELDIHHGICGTVLNTGEQKVQLLVQRTGGQGHYSENVTRLVNGVLPHVRQALRLSALAAQREQHLETALAASQAHPHPFALFDDTGRVTYLSPALERQLPLPQMRLTRAGIEFTQATLEQQFRGALRRLIRAATNSQTLEWRFTLPREGLPPIYCLLAPIYPGANPELSFWQTNIHAALYINDPLLRDQRRREQLQTAYQLTEAEAALALDIARGLSLKDIAGQSHRSIHTLRTQLKSVFSKTGCSRQGQLAALVNTQV